MTSKFRKILLILGLSLILSIVVVSAIQYVDSTQFTPLTLTTEIPPSNETVFSTPFKASVEKGVFESVGEVYVYLYCPYANYWTTFNVWMSLDNSSWVIVPFLKSTTNNLSQMANLGSINLNNPQLKIYVKSYIPTQTLFLPPNVTILDASNFTAHVLVQKQATPADRAQWIFVFLAIFFGVFESASRILDFIFSGKDSKSKSQNVGKKGKKISRVSQKQKKRY